MRISVSGLPEKFHPCDPVELHRELGGKKTFQSHIEIRTKPIRKSNNAVISLIALNFGNNLYHS